MAPVQPDLSQDDSLDPLAALDRKIEAAAEEMNSPDGLARLEKLTEERDGLLEDQTITAPMPVPPGTELIDARFMSQSHMDIDGNISGHTVQAIEIYQAPNGDLSGQVLDVGHYQDAMTATATYETLQESVDIGEIAINEVILLAEVVAEDNGLDKHNWREMTGSDLARYEYHTSTIDQPNRDLPGDSFSADAEFAARLFGSTLAESKASPFGNEQAIEALRGIGLETSPDFDLSVNAFFDLTSGDQVINGIFQADPSDLTQNNRPLVVTLSPDRDGQHMQAQALEYGQTGSFVEVLQEQMQVQAVLEDDGFEQVLNAIVDIEEQRLEVEPVMADITRWSMDID
jgi:hypothetical protein